LKCDHIVEIGILKVGLDGSQLDHTVRVNPGRSIPPEATAVHGITDKDVADCPSFSEIAASLVTALEGCDLCGFNIIKFDLLLICAEFDRAGRTFPLEGRQIVDVYHIFCHYEKRDLKAAVRFYCAREHDNAHSAKDDAMATAEVLDAMVGHYPDLPRSPAEIQRRISNRNGVDSSGNFVRNAKGEVLFNFGKHKGKPLTDIARKEPGYLGWMLTDGFYADTKAVVRKALESQRAL
jgi:DNA polymerase-3 subunit epsilon